MKLFFILILILSSGIIATASEDGIERSHERMLLEKQNILPNQKNNEEEKKSQVGADKGITEANEKDGIKLSKEAEEKFEIQRIKVLSILTEIPLTAIVTAGIEKNIYRYRNGFYRRIDFETKKRKADKVLIHSNDLKINDEIVIVGISFIRLAELAAFDGSEGHSH